MLHNLFHNYSLFITSIWFGLKVYKEKKYFLLTSNIILYDKELAFMCVINEKNKTF